MTPNQPKILVVDDDKIILRTCARILAPVEPDTASNGTEALKLICKQSFDVIVSDISMPGMDGKTLFQKVLDMSPSQAGRMLFMTGDAVPHSEFLRQFPTYIKKPFDKGDFLLAVKRVLNHE
jgi:CheY-like chemotaxis protein